MKELEQQLQFLGILNRSSSSSSSSPFSEFFTFPQYSSTGCEKSSTMAEQAMITSTNEYDHHVTNMSSSSSCNDDDDDDQRNRSYAAADIEVTMVENHANLKVRSKTRPKQLVKLVTGLLNLSLTVLHLNLTTVDQLVLYSLSLKV